MDINDEIIVNSPNPICWLCQEEIKNKHRRSVYGDDHNESVKKRQRACLLLLSDAGKEHREFKEGDVMCNKCTLKCHNRMDQLMERGRFSVRKQTPQRQKTPRTYQKKNSMDDEKYIDNKEVSGKVTDLDLNTSDNITVNTESGSLPYLTKRQRVIKPPKKYEEIAGPSASNSKKVLNPKSKKLKKDTAACPSLVSAKKLEFPCFDDDENSFCVEVCIDNVISAEAAALGGAQRIELCSALSEGGLTPTGGFLREVKSLVTIPVFVMIRTRSGDFLYSDSEIDIMKFDIKQYKHNGADGFVFGVLDKSGNVDEAKCRDLLQVADPLPCTFHRAFDQVANPMKALETIIQLGFLRILTSGQKSTAKEGIPLIKRLVYQARGRISIMAGAGVTPDSVGEIVSSTGVKEVHGSARVAMNSLMNVKSVNKVAMGSNPDDTSILVTDSNIVEKIVTIAYSAAKNSKMS